MIALDGNSLTIEQLVRIARHGEEVAFDPSTRERVAKSEALIARVVENYRRAWEAGQSVPHDYGITTGFGEFKNKAIAPEDLVQLQRNLLLSHSVGVGENTDPDDLANYFPAEVVRGALATRLNAFLKGHSGVRAKLVEVVEAMLNRGVIPLVPLRGSVGASGDLCPLSHLFVTLLGEGRFYIDGVVRASGAPPGSAPEARTTPTFHDASDLPALLGIDAEEMKPTFKEGLALVNGANFSAAMLALAAYDAQRLADLADETASLTLEAMAGCTRALDAKVHHERGHDGQIESAERMRDMIIGSRLDDRGLRACKHQRAPHANDARRRAQSRPAAESDDATRRELRTDDPAVHRRVDRVGEQSPRASCIGRLHPHRRERGRSRVDVDPRRPQVANRDLQRAGRDRDRAAHRRAGDRMARRLSVRPESNHAAAPRPRARRGTGAAVRGSGQRSRAQHRHATRTRHARAVPARPQRRASGVPRPPAGRRHSRGAARDVLALLRRDPNHLLDVLPHRIAGAAPRCEPREIQILDCILVEEPFAVLSERRFAERLRERFEIALVIAQPLDHVPVGSVHDPVREPSLRAIDLLRHPADERVAFFHVEDVGMKSEFEIDVRRFGIARQRDRALGE